MNLENKVRNILSSVRKHQDKALINFVRRFDGVRIQNSRDLRISKSDILNACRKISSSSRTALNSAANRIRQFHKEELRSLKTSWVKTNHGVQLGQILRPVSSCGLYIPGGRYSYPSTVLMTAIPAQIAGVKKIILVTPPQRISQEILYSAYLSGVSEIYRIGGPAAIAALAYGTKTIPKVNFIAGPGNKFVTEAKRQVYGLVGIDLLAGPSEIAILADETARSEWLALDMAAQCEHDTESRATLVSTNQLIIKKAKEKIPREFMNQCQFIEVTGLIEGAKIISNIAAEHVEIMTKQPKKWIRFIENAGAIFLGHTTPVAAGDYWLGPSHVLPTGKASQFSSGLSVSSFFKRTSLMKLSSGALSRGAKTIEYLAQKEGLTYHERSIKIRYNNS